ncbi:MAG: transcription termination factor Rho [Eubacteriales bacterium]|nr:transcription termination factor Rho [Eubacteriales bacterium]MDD3197466.1 transcription termination factor Rho [Eubacteriales bacterium]MDD4682569.1 transcription termination factor Rho [Eubacteriales bacterium]
MPSTNLTGKTKADLVALAELSGLMTATAARKMTKAALIEYFQNAESKSGTSDQAAPSAKTTKAKSPDETAPDLKNTPVKKKISTRGRKRKPELADTKTTAKSVEASVSISKGKAESDKTATDSTVADEQTVTQATARPARRTTRKTASAKKNTTSSSKTAAEKESSSKTAAEKISVDSSRSSASSIDKVTDEEKTGISAEIDKQAEADKQLSGKTQEKQTKSRSRGRPASSAVKTKSTTVKTKTTGRGRKNTVSKADQAVADNKDQPADKPEQAAAVAVEKTQTNSTDTLSNKNTQVKTTSDVDAKSEREIDSQKAIKTRAGKDNIQDTKQDTKQEKTQEPKQGEIADNKQSTQPNQSKQQRRPLVEQGEPVSGILEIMPDGYGFLRKDNYLQGNKDIYVPPQYIRRFNLRTGDFVTGPGKLQRENDRYQALLYVKEVNGMPPDKMIRRPQFDRLTPIYPDDRFHLETTRNELSTRIIDLAAPIGKGQRGMIVSPPKAGKTILLQKIANAISINNPDVKLIVLLIDERPEEVTDMQRSIKGEVVYSTFDKTPENHVKVTELVLERAMRLVELKQDVVILLDSMTRLARAYNLSINPTGRTLSGGLDPGALYGPKRFFGAARNIENGGSLTIIATSLIETGSRMDEVIFEEFKGTGNMEVYLDRKLSEKRIFPAIDINRSGTRREELLMTEKELDAVWTIRKAFSQLDTAAVTETIINLLLKTQNNEHFTSSINVSFNDKSVFEAMRGNRPAGSGNQNGNGNSGNRP